MSERRRRRASWLRRRRRELSALGRGLVLLPTRALHLPLRALGLAEPRRHRPAGAVPGALPELTEAERRPARLRLFHFDERHYEEQDEATVAEAAALRTAPGVTWAALAGLRDTAALEALGEAYGLHPLVLEDLFHTTQRPKLETYGATREPQLFIVLKMIHDPEETGGQEPSREVVVEQVGLVLGPSYVLSFQEGEGDVFEPVRERLRSGAGRIRAQGPDYLAYALIDVIVDHYFVVIEGIAERIEALEEAILREPRPEVQHEVSALRREVLFLRRAIWPLREVLNALLRDDSGLVAERTKVYLRDVYDHTIQAVDFIEGFRDVLGTLVDLYLSAVSFRTNEVMRVLTVIGSIFLPLTFITSLYGMNFDVMPELHAQHGYFIVLVVMIVVALGMIVFFRRRGWL